MSDAPDTAQPSSQAGDGQTQQAAPETKPEAQSEKQTLVTGADTEKGQTEVKAEPKFELKLPEGSYLAADAVEKAVARAKELKLSPEQAQAELSRESDSLKTFVEGEKQKLAAEVNGWVEQAKADAEIGGEKFKAAAEGAKRVVNRFGTEAFKKALNDSGLGNHPELIRTLYRISKGMTEDQLVLASGTPAPKRSAADVLYGDTSK